MTTTTRTMVGSSLVLLNFSLWGGCFAKQPPLSLTSLSLFHITKNPMWHCMRRFMRPLMCSNVPALMMTRIAEVKAQSKCIHKSTSNRHHQYCSAFTNPQAIDIISNVLPFHFIERHDKHRVDYYTPPHRSHGGKKETRSPSSFSHQYVPHNAFKQQGEKKNHPIQGLLIWWTFAAVDGTPTT